MNPMDRRITSSLDFRSYGNSTVQTLSMWKLCLQDNAILCQLLGCFPWWMKPIYSVENHHWETYYQNLVANAPWSCTPPTFAWRNTLIWTNGLDKRKQPRGCRHRSPGRRNWLGSSMILPGKMRHPLSRLPQPLLYALHLLWIWLRRLRSTLRPFVSVPSTPSVRERLWIMDLSSIRLLVSMSVPMVLFGKQLPKNRYLRKSMKMMILKRLLICQRGLPFNQSICLNRPAIS